jgi:hypothetical protein
LFKRFIVITKQQLRNLLSLISRLLSNRHQAQATHTIIYEFYVFHRRNNKEDN